MINLCIKSLLDVRRYYCRQRRGFAKLGHRRTSDQPLTWSLSCVLKLRICCQAPILQNRNVVRSCRLSDIYASLCFECNLFCKSLICEVDCMSSILLCWAEFAFWLAGQPNICCFSHFKWEKSHCKNLTLSGQVPNFEKSIAFAIESKLSSTQSGLFEVNFILT